jgi:hypothetical protein
MHFRIGYNPSADASIEVWDGVTRVATIACNGNGLTVATVTGKLLAEVNTDTGPTPVPRGTVATLWIVPAPIQGIP